MSDTPKMIRETLCVAQTAVGLLPDDYQAGRTRDEHIAQLQRLHDATVDVPESREQCGCANLALSSASTGQLAMLARTDSAGRPLYRVTSGGNIVRTKPITKCLKKRILTRDGNRCVECGSTKWLEIAHIEPYRVGGNNADDNLRTLCNPCHQAEGRNAVLSH